jgi:putative transposase
MLAKSVHNAAWAQLVQHVRYKAESAGVEVRLVDPRRTSQTCPECGTITPKTLAQREHRCDCGCVLDRDVAAARVVLHLAGLRPGTGLQAQSVRDAA